MHILLSTMERINQFLLKEGIIAIKEGTIANKHPKNCLHHLVFLHRINNIHCFLSSCQCFKIGAIIVCFPTSSATPQLLVWKVKQGLFQNYWHLIWNHIIFCVQYGHFSSTIQWTAAAATTVTRSQDGQQKKMFKVCSERTTEKSSLSVGMCHYLKIIQIYLLIGLLLYTRKSVTSCQTSLSS